MTIEQDRLTLTPAPLELVAAPEDAPPARRITGGFVLGSITQISVNGVLIASAPEAAAAPVAPTTGDLSDFSYRPVAVDWVEAAAPAAPTANTVEIFVDGQRRTATEITIRHGDDGQAEVQIDGQPVPTLTTLMLTRWSEHLTVITLLTARQSPPRETTYQMRESNPWDCSIGRIDDCLSHRLAEGSVLSVRNWLAPQFRAAYFGDAADSTPTPRAEALGDRQLD